MTCFKGISEVKFELSDTITTGVIGGKTSGFTIPVVLNDENVRNKIVKLSEEHGCIEPFIEDTIFLRSNKLSEKQTYELHEEGRQPILVHFTAVGIKPIYDRKILVFKVTKLRKLEKEDSCPED